MASPIEDYALIGDTHTAALVGRDGSIDWWCVPRYDSPACFAALLGGPENGRFLLAPAGEVTRSSRAYRPGTMVLETEFTNAEGTVKVIDCMPHRRAAPDEEGSADLLRVVQGVSGRVPMHLEMIVRFDYGATVPWVQHGNGGIDMIAGPNGLHLYSEVPTRGQNFHTVADFTVAPGDQVGFLLHWHRSHRLPGPQPAVAALLADTTAFWETWSAASTYRGEWPEAVQRSLLTLKALTYEPTGGIIAAPTTSLPERLGGARNWDYRYCWLRDATYTLHALLQGGYKAEASAWRDWLLRAVAGRGGDLQIMYGAAGERSIPEFELAHLPGYQGAAPVRIGNAAADQFQLDVYGEVMDTLHHAGRHVGNAHTRQGEIQVEMLEFLESNWREPDEGIWEVRSGRQNFTHSKVMAWVALDRAVRACDNGLNGPRDRWAAVRDEVHALVCERGYDADQQSFTQAFGSPVLDASLLMLPLVGFLPADDPRIVGTVQAVEAKLLRNGFMARYDTTEADDGLGEPEGAFLLCTFWLAQALACIGRRQDARTVFERLLAVRNDVGLLAEEYDPVSGRFLGNFPQAYSHVGLINTAIALGGSDQPVRARC